MKQKNNTNFEEGLICPTALLLTEEEDKKEETEIETPTNKLEEYYKNVYECKKCKRKYGSDVKERIRLCPDCLLKYQRWKRKKR